MAEVVDGERGLEIEPARPHGVEGRQYQVRPGPVPSTENMSPSPAVRAGDRPRDPRHDHSHSLDRARRQPAKIAGVV